MPEAPSVGLFTRYVLENPYPLGIGLLAVGVIVGWLALREGRLERLRVAGAAIVVGAAALVAGVAVTTAGERGRAVTRELIQAVVDEDVVGARNLLAEDARMHFGSARNIAWDLDYILSALSRVADRFDIEENRITKLRGYTESGEAATVHAGCWTDAGYGLTPSQWVLEVQRQGDGSWKVTRLTCISISGRAPGAPPW